MSLSWIKIDINIMDDTKIKQLRKMPAGDTLILFWVHLLCLAMKSGKPGILEIGDGIPFNAETLAIDFGVELNTVKMALDIFQKFRMIEQFEDGTLYITNFEKHQELGKIERQKQISRNSSKKHRDKQKKLLSDGHVTQSDVTDKDLDKDLDKEPLCEKDSHDLAKIPCPKCESRKGLTRKDTGIRLCLDCEHKFNPAPPLKPKAQNGQAQSELKSGNGAGNYSPEFEEWWSHWIDMKRNVAKPKCFEKWKKLSSKRDSKIQFQINLNSIIKKQKPFYLELKPHLRPHPMTYLNGGRWEDTKDAILSNKESTRPEFKSAITL